MARNGGRSLEARIRRGKVRTCRSKKVYNTVQSATIDSFKYLNAHKTLLSVYECGNCGKYHLTSKGTNMETGQIEEFMGDSQ